MRLPRVPRLEPAGGAVLAGAALPLALTLALPGPTFVSPQVLFAVTVAGAAAGLVASTLLLWTAHRDDVAEQGAIAAAFLVLSLLRLVQGLTTPSVLYGTNQATLVSFLYALPLAALVVLPTLGGRSPWANRLLRSWRSWAANWCGLAAAFAALLLVRPNALTSPGFASRAATTIAGAGAVVLLLAAVRHLRLHRSAVDAAPAVVAVGFAATASAVAVWVGSAPYTVGYWLAHVGSLAAAVVVPLAVRAGYRQRRSLLDVLRPVLQVEPLSAFELGLDRTVHRFVTELQVKDLPTKEHVVRTAELAVRLGAELGVAEEQLRLLGLGALFHDLGKLQISDEILGKRGRLDADEFATMRRHTVLGQAIAGESPALRGIGPVLRSHHERVDGRGYPDGLTGDAIPLFARIVAVCDAYDAMANTRVYREGMGRERALAVLREHAGSQWDARVVDALVELLRIDDPELDPHGDDSIEALAWASLDRQDLLPLPDCACAFDEARDTARIPA